MWFWQLKNLLKKIKFVFPIIGTILIVCLFHFGKLYFLKFYPVVMNFFIFSVFFSSLFCQETIIQKFAKKLDGELTDFSRNYTRKLTYVWCIFLFINLSISFITVFLSPAIWELYNACISYVALGIMFGVEYIIRIILRRRYEQKNKVNL